MVFEENQAEVKAIQPDKRSNSKKPSYLKLLSEKLKMRKQSY